MRKLLIVPLGHHVVPTPHGLISSAEGLDRMKAAVTLGAINEMDGNDVVYGALPGTCPRTRGTRHSFNLGTVMTKTLVAQGVLRSRIIQGGDNVWGTLGEIKEALRLGREYGRSVVFVSNKHHILRLELACIEVLGFFQYAAHKNAGRIAFLGVASVHTPARDQRVEPLKNMFQIIRITLGPLRRFIPETLGGRL